MAVDAISSEYESTDFQPKDTFDIQANPSTWFMLALLLGNLEMFDFSFGSSSTYTDTSTWTDAEIEAGVRYFFKTGIHQMPQEIAQDRALIADNLSHWMDKFQLKPIQVADLEQVTHASSGTYFLYEGGTPAHVVKPIDEDIMCIHNPIFPGFPGAHIQVRDNIPLYHSAERECAAFEISHQMGLEIVPTTSLAAVDSPDFHDISDSFYEGKWNTLLHLFKMEEKCAEFMKQSGTGSSLKLCSLRDYVPSSQTLSSFADQEQYDLSDIDPRDIVAANLLMWVSGNTDGHPGNILVYPKGVQENGRPLFGLQVIDLCLAFPEQNGYLLNTLPDMFISSMVLPEWARDWIKGFSMQTALEIMGKYELDGCTAAMQERIEALQLFADQDLTIEEIDTRLKYLGTQKAAALDIDKPFPLPRYNNSFASTWTSTTDSTFVTPTSWLRA